MHTSNSEIQLPMVGHRRGRYRAEFKRQIVTACREAKDSLHHVNLLMIETIGCLQILCAPGSSPLRR